MITRITLTNFMSHAKTVIEPAAGLTVLVGPNNVGKSAIVAALQILCRNENSTYVMRHGERECSVVVETDDGHVVEWRRKKSPSYLIDGKVCDRKLDKDFMTDLHRVLRLPRVDAGDNLDFDVHFGTQKSPIFLLGSASAAARFFASSSDAVRLVEVQKRHKQKLADAQREKLRLEAESRIINEQLALLDPVVEIDDRLQAVEDRHAELLNLRDRLQKARSDEAILAAETTQLVQRQAQANALASLSAPPDLFPVSQLAELIHGLDAAHGDLAAATAREAALSRVVAPPSLHDVASLERLWNDIGRQTIALQCEAESCRALQPLAAAPELASTEPLRQSLLAIAQAVRDERLAGDRFEALLRIDMPPDLSNDAALKEAITALAQAASEVATWEARSELVHDVAQPPVPEDTTPLAQLIGQWEDAVSEERRHVKRLKEAADQLTDAADALRDMAAGSQCRLCGSPLDPERVVAFAVAGMEGHPHE